MTEEQSLSDLDALVLAEIKSASGRQGRRRPAIQASTPQRRDSRAEEVEAQAQSREVARIHGEDRDNEALSGEEAALLDLPEMAMVESEDLPPAKLFTPEEEAFMHRAIGFLSGRDNGDVILGRIWEQLTESHPERYYESPQEATDSAVMSDQNRADLDDEDPHSDENREHAR